MASSIDGKIGPADVKDFVAITSSHDMEHLKTIRDQADGILFGASTFRTWPKVHRGHRRGPFAPHFILSRSLDLDPQAPLFQENQVPVTVFASKKAPNSGSLPNHINVVQVAEGPGQISEIINHIRQLGIQALLIEGGGSVLHQFIAAQQLQELYLTLSPIIIGDKKAPALLSNRLISPLPQVTVRASRVVEDEIYLHLGLTYPES